VCGSRRLCLSINSATISTTFVHDPCSKGMGGDAGDKLPARYVCRACSVCIATSEHLVKAQDDVIVFGRLHNSNEAGGDKAIVCPYCGSSVGSKGGGQFLLRRERVVQRAEILEILICSLKQQEISELTPFLQEAFPQSNITSRVLQKSELRGFQQSELKPMLDLVVVVHRNEGRVLLTDRNGFYHDVLGSAWQQTRGNVLVVLTRAATKADTDLCDAQLINSLSTQGDQPTIGAISTLGRVLTWESSPSTSQLKHLHSLMTRAYYSDKPPSVNGIPEQWSKQPQKPASSSWCNVL